MAEHNIFIFDISESLNEVDPHTKVIELFVANMVESIWLIEQTASVNTSSFKRNKESGERYAIV